MNAPVTSDRPPSSAALGSARFPCTANKGIDRCTHRQFGRTRAREGALNTTTSPHSLATESSRSFVRLNTWVPFILLLLATLFCRVSAAPSDSQGLAARRGDGSANLQRRSPAGEVGTTIIATPTATKTAAAPTLRVDPTAAQATGMPTPFDTALLSTNLTSDCSTFMKGFLETQDFKACKPLSMLLQTSDSFFTVLQKGAFAITKVIDQTCDVNVDACSKVMEKYGRSLISKDNCGTDYGLLNPIISQAYAGFQAYRALYSAGCLKSTDGNYCYVEAVTNRQSPSDALIYFLPLGTSLAGDSTPNELTFSCSKCLKDTMAIFAGSAGNASLPISKVYRPAAEQINARCGADFVQASVTPLPGSSASSISPVFLYSTVAGVLTFITTQL